MFICDVTPENAMREGFFCIRSPSNRGVGCKKVWFAARYREGLCLKILRDDSRRQVAFIEYLPAEMAWRPVSAPNYMFIHCISGHRKQDRGKGYASLLIRACEDDARDLNRSGVAVMTSSGPWMASRQVFLKNGFDLVEQRGRFELLARKFDRDAADPRLIDWEAALAGYRGWHLVYADQCPWHDKAACDLADVALSEGIVLHITKLTTAQQARRAPSGFGVMSLVHDGELVEDHYISATRFRTILRQRGT